MIVSPDWSTLRGVAAGLDSADPIQRQKALEQTIQLVTDELPDVNAVRLYVLDGQTLIVRAATDFEQKAVKSLSAMPLAAAALERDAGAWEPGRATLEHAVGGDGDDAGRVRGAGPGD